MLYRIAYWLMWVALRIYYRAIRTQGLERLPPKGPLILYANHPGSALDAFLLGVLLDRPIHFFARGDMFAHPLAAKYMRKLHMHPVFHHEAGRATIGQNDETIDAALRLLDAGEVILFFPEGNSHTDYHLSPFRKGVFRIALQWLAEHPHDELQAFPVGINYEHPTKAGGLINVQGGQAFSIRAFCRNEFTPAMLRNLTQYAHQQLLPLVVHHPERDASHQAPFALSKKRWEQTKNEDTWFVDFYQSSINEITIPEKSAKPWKKRWKDGLDYRWVYQTPQAHHSLFWMIVLAPGALLGSISNGIPLALAKGIARKKVYREDFYAWIQLAAATGLYLLWWLICVVLSVFFLPIQWAGMVAVGLPLLGICWRCWTDQYERWLRNKIISTYPNISPPE